MLYSPSGTLQNQRGMNSSREVPGCPGLTEHTQGILKVRPPRDDSVRDAFRRVPFESIMNSTASKANKRACLYRYETLHADRLEVEWMEASHYITYMLLPFWRLQQPGRLFNSRNPAIPNSLRTHPPSTRAVKDAFDKYSLLQILPSDAHPHNKMACLFLNAYEKLNCFRSRWLFWTLPAFLRRRIYCASMDMHRLWRASAQSFHGVRPSTYTVHASISWPSITRAMLYNLSFSSNGLGYRILLILIASLFYRVWHLQCMLEESTGITTDDDCHGIKSHAL